MTEELNKNDPDPVVVNKNRLIIHNELPSHVKFDQPVKPEKFFQQEPKFYKHVRDFLSLKNRRLKSFFIVLAVLCLGFFVFISISKSPVKKRQSIYNPPEASSLTQTKSFTITTSDIEKTISLKEGDTQEALDPKKYVVGDKVLYKGTQIDEELLEELKDRNYDTPLNIVLERGSSTNFYAERLYLPKNSYVRAYLDRSLHTGNLDIPVSGITFTDLKNNEEILLPKNSRLIGRAGVAMESDRVLVEFSSVVFPDGKEYSIRGVALGEDNVAGLPADLNYKLGQKSTNVFLRSMLGATGQSMTGFGNSFGEAFAGNLANNTSDNLDEALDFEGRNNGVTVSVEMNTRFKVVFN